MPAQPQLAVIIVAWNVRDLVVDCLQSVYDDLSVSKINGRVLVVDNGSSDGTADAVRRTFSQADVLEPGDNLGFARGNNLAIRALGFPDGDDLPEFVLLLNPDTVLRPGALRALIEGMVTTGAGLAGARLVFSNNAFQHSAFAFPGLAQLAFDLFPTPARLQESRLNGRYPRRLYRGGKPFVVDFPLGATFLLHRDVILQTGMFDEQFHLYCEEIDWAIRIKQSGWTAICVPTAEVVHYGGQSTMQDKPRSLVNLWTARLKLYRKHYGRLKRMVSVWFMRAGMNRMIQATARDSSRDEDTAKALVDAYRKIINLTYEL